MKRLVLIFSLILLVGFLGVVYAQSCTDSDNGVNYYAKGQVVVLENGTSLSYNDACVYKLEGTNAEFYVKEGDTLYNNKAECSDSNCYVAEAFCENSVKKWTVKTCPNGCSNGACLCPTTKCSDGSVYGPEKCSVKENTCVCPSCPAVPETCKQEGAIINWQDSSSQCCGGLAKITESSAYSSDCGARIISANYVCTNCGNGVCGTGESKCNCLQDCKTGSTTNTTPVCSPTKCSDGSVYECKIINGICSCPTCPAQPVINKCGKLIYFYADYCPHCNKTNLEIDEFSKIAGCVSVTRIETTKSDIDEKYNVDGVPSFIFIDERGCQTTKTGGDTTKEYLITMINNFVSNCNVEKVTERITCKFEDTQKEQKCYLAGQFTDADLGTKYCIAAAGSGSCVIAYTSYKGEQVTWKSSCGQYQYTTMDGNDEVIYFKCSEGETNTTQIMNRGFRKVYFQCYDGAESKSTDREACKPADYWKKFAMNFCESHCENSLEKCKQKYGDEKNVDVIKCIGKCGINSFSIGEECYLEESATCGVGNLPPCEEECKIDSDCIGKIACSCAEGYNCEVKCKENKCSCSGTVIEPIVVCKDSCPLDGKCYPFGYRKDGKFCSDSGGFVAQKGSESCDNNFECSSNVCVSGNCIEEGFLNKIINWFKKLFGG